MMQEVSIPLGPNGKPKKPLGVVWYATQDNFERMQKECPDFTDETYQDWLEAATEALEVEGQPKVPVTLDPEVFFKWCKLNGFEPRVEARQKFVHDLVEGAFSRALKEFKTKKRTKKSY